MELLKNILGSLVALTYPIGSFCTFVWLLREDLPDTPGFIRSAIVFLCDGFLAFIWPIYWGVLRWAF